MTWIIISIVIAVAMLIGFGAIYLRDLRERRQAKRRRPPEPIIYPGPHWRCDACGMLPLFEDEASYLRKHVDGRHLCGRCERGDK